MNENIEDLDIDLDMGEVAEELDLDTEAWIERMLS